MDYWDLPAPQLHQWRCKLEKWHPFFRDTSWDIQGSCLFHNHLGQPLKKTSMSSTKRPFSHKKKSMYLWDINPAWLVLIGCFLWVFMQANIYKFYLQEFFCQKLNVCQKNIRLGDIMTVMTSQYLHHKKKLVGRFYHQSEANMLVKMGSSSPIFRVNMLKIRELPPARKTSTPFLDVSSAFLRLSSSSISVTTVAFPIGSVVSSGMKTREASSWCDQKGGS